jgi:hypothetical protein
MVLTRTNIHNRLVLANCCMADLVTDYLEAERMGDESRMACKLKDGYLLASTIAQLKCWRPSIPGGAVWAETFTGSLTPAVNASIEMSFMGYTILPEYGFPTLALKAGIVDAVAAYGSQDWTILRAWVDASGAFGTVYVEYDPEIITPSATPIEFTLVGGSVTTSGNGAIVTNSPWVDLTSTTTAEKLFGILDSICDCPCNKPGSEITDDTLPKYTREG